MVLVLDQAQWHTTQKLAVPEGVQLVYLGLTEKVGFIDIIDVSANERHLECKVC